MQVYAEYAFIENFCMDAALLYAAKAITKNCCRMRRILIAAALGASFAVAYPLFGIERLAAPWSKIVGIAVKICAGWLLCAVAGKYSRPIGFARFGLIFMALTFVLGGALIAVFSLAGVSYSAGAYVLTSVPVGIPLFFVLILILISKKFAAKFRSKKADGAYVCTVCVGDREVKLAAFYDSGNKVYFGGAPVSIIPKNAAQKIIDLSRIKTFTDIHTVSGRGKIAVFRADRAIISDGSKTEVKSGLMFGVSPTKITRIVMHADIAEVN